MRRFLKASAAALSASSSSSFSSLHHHQQQQKKKEVVGEKSDVVSDGMESIGACMTIGGRRRMTTGRREWRGTLFHGVDLRHRLRPLSLHQITRTITKK